MNCRCRGKRYQPYLSNEDHYLDNNFISQENLLRDEMAADFYDDCSNPYLHFKRDSMQAWKTDWEYQKAKCDCFKLKCLNGDDNTNVKYDKIKNEDISKEESPPLKKENGQSQNNDILKIEFSRDLFGKALCLEIPIRLVVKSLNVLRTLAQPKVLKKEVDIQQSEPSPVGSVNSCAPLKLIGMVFLEIWKTVCNISKACYDILECSSCRPATKDTYFRSARSQELNGNRKKSREKRKSSDCTEVKIVCCGKRGKRVCEELIKNVIESDVETEIEEDLERGENIDKQTPYIKRSTLDDNQSMFDGGNKQSRDVIYVKPTGRSISKSKQKSSSTERRLKTEEFPDIDDSYSPIRKERSDKSKTNFSASRERRTTKKKFSDKNLKFSTGRPTARVAPKKRTVGSTNCCESLEETEAIKLPPTESKEKRRSNKTHKIIKKSPASSPVIPVYSDEEHPTLRRPKKLSEPSAARRFKVYDSELTQLTREMKETGSSPASPELQLSYPSKVEKRKSLPVRVRDSQQIDDFFAKDNIRSKSDKMKKISYSDLPLDEEDIKIRKDRLKKMVQENIPTDDRLKNQKDELEKLVYANVPFDEKQIKGILSAAKKDKGQTLMKDKEDIENLIGRHKKVLDKVDYDALIPDDVKKQFESTIPPQAIDNLKLKHHAKIKPVTRVDKLDEKSDSILSVDKPERTKIIKPEKNNSPYTNIAEADEQPDLDDIPHNKMKDSKKSNSMRRFLNFVARKKTPDDTHEVEQDKRSEKHSEDKEKSLADDVVDVNIRKLNSLEMEIEEQERQVQEMIKNNKREKEVVWAKRKSDPVTHTKKPKHKVNRAVTDDESSNKSNNFNEPINKTKLKMAGEMASGGSNNIHDNLNNFNNIKSKNLSQDSGSVKSQLGVQSYALTKDSVLTMKETKKPYVPSKKSIIEDKISKRQAKMGRKDSGNSTVSSIRTLGGTFKKNSSDSSNSLSSSTRKMKNFKETPEVPQTYIQNTSGGRKSILKSTPQEFPPIPDEKSMISNDSSDSKSMESKTNSKYFGASMSRYFRSVRTAFTSLVGSRNRKPKQIIPEGRRTIVSFVPEPVIQRLPAGSLNTSLIEVEEDKLLPLGSPVP